MLGYRSGGVQRRGHPLSHGALADSGDRGRGGGEACAGDHGKRDLPGGRGTLDDGRCPRATGGNELTRQQLHSLDRRGSYSRKLTRNQLDVELLRLRRRGVRCVVIGLVDDLRRTGSYRAVGKGHLRGG